MTIIYLLRGNTMATKNLIVHTLWIIQMYEIPRAKPPIQNCLGYLFRERVGIITTNTKPLGIPRGFGFQSHPLAISGKPFF